MQDRKAPYMNRTLNAELRAGDLLRRMQLEEKIRQMSMGFLGRLMKSDRLSAKAMRAFFKGRSIGCLQEERTTARRSAEAVNGVQRYLVEHTRLGIPALIAGETLHGHYATDSTSFPQAIALGSTWNPGLVARMAEAAAREARAHGVAQALGPDLDLARDPRWGRVEETYGEDPYLVGRMGVAYIKAMQGAGPGIDGNHLACMAKHFAAHGSPEAGLNMGPVPGGLRELHSLYLPPFKAAVTEAGVLSVMPAYSEYDGVPASASRLLLQKILREEWGFQGYVFADYSAISLLIKVHRTAANPAQAGRQALLAGMDMETPSEHCFGDCLLDLVRRGEVPVELIDQAVSRILRVKFMLGLFENPFVDVKRAQAMVNPPAHRKLARAIAQESIILLQNRGRLLPLDGRKLRSIAVIGPNADVAQLGDYCKPRPDAVTPLQGIRAAAGRKIKVTYARGCGLYELDREGFAPAVAAARASDVAIVVIGESSLHFGGVGWGVQGQPALCGEGFDRNEITPPGLQAELVRAVHATGTPTVVVLMNGRALAIPWMAENIPAIVEAWYPGEQGGHALADILFGKVNPSGKLTVSVPRSTGHIPCCYNRKPSAGGYYHKPGAPGRPGYDYVFDEAAPLWSFGHGLSYTTFKYSRLRVEPGQALPGGRVRVTVDVRNAGRHPGKEVVQLYVRDVVSSVTTPRKALKGFAKISLNPGARQTVAFELGPRELELLDGNMNWTVEPGAFEVEVAGLKKSFQVIDPGCNLTGLNPAAK